MFTVESFTENPPVPSLKKVEGLEGQTVVQIASGAEHSALLTGIIIYFPGILFRAWLPPTFTTFYLLENYFV
jgi:Regulator of chromosome condensation (RCC1) repeat